MKGKISKNTNKSIILALLLCIAMVLSPLTSLINNIVLSAATDVNYTDLRGATLSISGFNDSVNLGDNCILPTVSYKYPHEASSSLLGWSSAESQVVYEIIKPDGDVFVSSSTEDKTDKILLEGGKPAFKADMIGTYSLNVYVKDAVDYDNGTDSGTISTVKTVAKGLKIAVNNDSYSMKLQNNSVNVIPAKVPTNTTLKFDEAIIYDGDEVITTIPAGFVRKASLILPNDTTEVLSLVTGKKYYEKQVTAVGNYKLVYTYENTDGFVFERITKDFEVVTGSDFVNDIEMKLELTESKIFTAEVSKEITLPSVNVINSKSSSSTTIDAYIEVVVECTPSDGGETIDYSSRVKDFKFTPEDKGTYAVTYKARNYVYEAVSGWNSTFVEGKNQISWLIENVEDKKEPEVLFVNPYTLDEDKNITKINNVSVPENADVLELLGNRLQELPSVVQLSGGTANVTIPAVYAEDNISANSKVTLSRKIKYPNTTTWVEIKNSEDEAFANNDDATFAVTATGTYSLRIEAIDEDENKSIVNHSFVVYPESGSGSLASKYTVLPAPSVVMANLASTAYNNQKITFAIPTATDELDKYISLETKISGTKQSDSSAFETILDSTFEKNGKYVLDLSELDVKVGTDLTIQVKATSDYNIIGTTVTRVISIKDSNDDVLPEISFKEPNYSTALLSANAELFVSNAARSIEEGRPYDYSGGIDNSGMLVNLYEGRTYAPFDQDQIITLPSIEIIEANIFNTKVGFITVTDRNGSEIKLTNNYIYNRVDEDTIELSDATFKAVLPGTYTVTYTVQDIGGNISVMSFGVVVNDTNAPEDLIFTDSGAIFKNKHQLGTKFIVPVAGLKDDGEEVEVNGIGTATTSWRLISTLSCATDNETYIIPFEEGTYIIEYTGTDTEGNIIVKNEELEVVDKINPIISLDYPASYKSDYEWNTEDNFVNVIIPFASATDYCDPDDITSYQNIAENKKLITPTISGPSNSNVNRAEDGKYWTFKATKQGAFTVSYTVKDLAGNEDVKTLTINIGDVVKPTIKFEEDATTVPPTTKELNSSYTLSVAELLEAISDNESEIANIKYTITMTGPNDEEVLNEYKTANASEADRTKHQYKWNLNSVGDYVLKIVVTDEANNTRTETYTINVPEVEKEDDKDMSNVVGTILIILSVVVLAGVVVAFAISNKKLNTKNKSKKNND